jgi:hypothetical protein
MASTLRRCVSLGASGVISPGGSQDYSRNSAFLAGTGTRWTRLWADWPSLQPEAALAPDKGSGATRLAALDRQIKQANAEGVSVMLTVWRFPRWANGTATLTPSQDAAYQLQDRISQGADPGSRKALEFKLPADLAPASAYGAFLDFLVRRYNSGNASRPATIAALEVVNEPNLQVWPQQGPSTTTNPYGSGVFTAQLATAQMFVTAQAVNARYGNRVLLLGPATADRTGDSRLASAYSTFTRALVQRLTAIAFKATSTFAWSVHNYTDVEYDQGAGSSLGRTTNRAADVRRLIAGAWAGWPSSSAANPGIAITEGGARLVKLASVYGLSDPAALRSKQASLLKANWDRMYLGSDGAGVGMLSWYLFYTDVNFDDGLCEVDGTKRPAYSTWGTLPSLR